MDGENVAPEKGQASIGVPSVELGETQEPSEFYSYSEDGGKVHSFKAKEELDKFVKDGLLLRSDYDRKRGAEASARKDWEEQKRREYEAIEELKKALPEVKKLISEGKIKEADFEYEKYFGPEIIP